MFDFLKKVTECENTYKTKMGCEYWTHKLDICNLNKHLKVKFVDIYPLINNPNINVSVAESYYWDSTETRDIILTIDIYWINGSTSNIDKNKIATIAKCYLSDKILNKHVNIDYRIHCNRSITRDVYLSLGKQYYKYADNPKGLPFTIATMKILKIPYNDQHISIFQLVEIELSYMDYINPDDLQFNDADDKNG